VVLSLAHTGWSAAAAIPAGARHVCYSAGPPRALYEHSDLYLLDYPRTVRATLRMTIPAVRAHHRRMMRRPDRLVTNSRWSADELARLVGVAPDVVYPPVRTEFFTPSEAERGHFLVVARLKPHKRVDVVIDAFRELDDRVVVVGGGPWLDRLRRSAPPNVSFTGYVSDAELRRLYRASHAVLCPSIEEFGIVMAEAHATATPVIAPRAGGALEIVEDGRTGVLLDQIGTRELATAVRDVSWGSFDREALLASAERFSVERFVDGMDAVIAEERERAGLRLVPDRSERVAH
jgi:glycosyltransferase involved in cell wall biosynthesis